MCIVENSLLTVAGPEDWSRVRSPSRARRRMKYGHRQNIGFPLLPDPSFYVVGEVVYCHPATAWKLRAALDAKAAQIDRDLEGRFAAYIRGSF